MDVYSPCVDSGGIKMANTWLITSSRNLQHTPCQEKPSRGGGGGGGGLDERCAVFNCLHLGLAEPQPPESPGELTSVQELTLWLSVDW